MSFAGEEIEDEKESADQVNIFKDISRVTRKMSKARDRAESANELPVVHIIQSSKKEDSEVMSNEADKLSGYSESMSSLEEKFELDFGNSASRRRRRETKKGKGEHKNSLVGRPMMPLG